MGMADSRLPICIHPADLAVLLLYLEEPRRMASEE